MKHLCSKITNLLLEEHVIKDSEVNVCNMGLQLIISDIINFSVIILFGLLIRRPLYSLIYLGAFSGVRKFSGGFHAKTFFVCRMSMIGIFLTIVLLTELLSSFAMEISLFCILFAIYTMVRFSPIIHPNRPLTTTEAKANKLVSVLAAGVCAAISILLVVFDYNEGLYLAFVLLAIAILMYIGKFVNAKNKAI